MTTTDGFFEKQTDKSRVKTLIVTDFLKAYFPIILQSVGKNVSEIIYLDFFCGPGQFEDGVPSTPIALLNYIGNSKNDDIRNKLHIVFNDEKAEYIEALIKTVEVHPVIPTLKFKPEIMNRRAGEIDINQYTCKKCPIFSFIDPWGYKDISTEQTWELIKNIGSDCVLFFNSNRFLMDFSKEASSVHYSKIFGEQLPEIRSVVENNQLSQKKKTQLIVELFSKNMYKRMEKEVYSKYRMFVLPFVFEADDKEKVSHHIVFITKSHKAVIEMKKVMLKHCNLCGTQLGFDSKDQFQISLTHRSDYITDDIIKLVKEYCRENSSFCEKSWTVSSLLETLDSYNMKLKYQVTPYSVEEIKNAIKHLDRDNQIELIVHPNQKIRDRITDDREFKIRKNLWG